MKAIPRRLPEYFRTPILQTRTVPKTRRPLYEVWRKIRRRCYNYRDPYFKDYGGKGIKLYEPWEDFLEFEKYINTNLGPKKRGMALARKDKRGDFAPGNLAWVTAQENAQSAIASAVQAAAEKAMQEAEEAAERAVQAERAMRLAKREAVQAGRYASGRMIAAQKLNGSRPLPPRAKLNYDQVSMIKALYETGEHSYGTLSKMYGVSRNNIALIIRGANWKYVEPRRLDP